MSEEEVVIKKSKKEKSDKKDKKEKKAKSKKHEVEDVDGTMEATLEDAAIEEVASGQEEGADEPKKEKKKRKREEQPDDLEIDVSLPEPPSKKALRKAKKAKTEKSSSSSKPAKEIKDDDDDGENEIKFDNDEELQPAKEKEERRTEHSIWIGNLPWTATKQDLKDFLLDQAAIPATRITRVHMPAPSAAVAKDTKGRPAFKNRGFAYVDFDSADMLFAALQVTETPFGRSDRKVLVKDAKSFEGRPEEHVGKTAEERKAAGNDEKPPNKRVFIGNLAFDVTKEDLDTHFGQCGAIDNIHMATFEDSGKCKGYAWITFDTLEAAEAAVKGFVLKEQQIDDDGGDDAAEEGAKLRKKPKPRKWFINRLNGREIKREYAEDASTRYRKRYGKDRPRVTDEAANSEHREPEAGAAGKPQQQKNSSHDRRREQRRAQKVDARTIAPGAALSHAPRASAAISAGGQKGTKVTFD